MQETHTEVKQLGRKVKHKKLKTNNLVMDIHRHLWKKLRAWSVESGGGPKGSFLEHNNNKMDVENVRSQWIWVDEMQDRNSYKMTKRIVEQHRSFSEKHESKSWKSGGGHRGSFSKHRWHKRKAGTWKTEHVGQR